MVERPSFGLRIGATNDAYEREADRISDSIVASLDAPPRWSLSTMQLAGRMQRKCACGGAGSCDACAAKADENEATIQRMPAGPEPETFAPSLVEDVLRSEGAPLDPTARRYFESRFGHDFSRVRVHVGGRAAQSARAVNALAYTVGNHVVFGSGMYAPESTAGRRLLAHELAHTVQQSRGGARPGWISSGTPEHQAEQAANAVAWGSGHVQIAGATGPGLARQAGPRPPLPAVTAQELIERLVIAVRGFASNEPGIPEFDPTSVGSAVGKGYETYAAVQLIDKEGNQILTGIGAYVSKNAPHGEQAAVAALRRSLPPGTDLTGARMMVAVDQVPCDGCSSALDAFAEEVGVSKMEIFIPSRPSLTNPAAAASAKTAARTATMVGRNWQAKLISTRTFKGTPSISPPGKGTAPEAPTNDPAAASTAAEPKAGSAAPGKATTPVQVGTEIKVNSSVQQPNGTTVSEVEYNFGKNLDQLNHGAPAGGEVPARITVRITQNSEGAITAVESLSGEPQALVEALARQTIPEGLAGGAEAAAAGGARRLALLSKGLKIGGLAAFVVVTGYQLYKATPEQRPRVATQAAGGLAGGALGSYLVCNALLDLETAGWGILICGLIVGGAAGYAGSELAGDAYDEATATDLSRALRRLDARSRNDRILFNLLLGALGPSAAGCIDADFVDRFLSTAPPNLKDYEVVLIAGRLKPTAVVLPSMTGRGTVCPNCHAENRPSPVAAGGGQNLYQAMAAACRNALDSTLKGLRGAIAQLPPAQRPATVSQLAAPGETHAAPSGAQSPSAGKSLQDVCPNCHRAVTADPGRNLTKEFGGLGTGPGGQMTETDLKLLSDWARAQQKPAP
jgi:hypothetical protein